MPLQLSWQSSGLKIHVSGVRLPPKAPCGYGGIGRHTSFRYQRFGVGVQVPLPVPSLMPDQLSGRASRLHREGRRFNPVIRYQFWQSPCSHGIVFKVATKCVSREPLHVTPLAIRVYVRTTKKHICPRSSTGESVGLRNRRLQARILSRAPFIGVCYGS